MCGTGVCASRWSGNSGSVCSGSLVASASLNKLPCSGGVCSELLPKRLLLDKRKYSSSNSTRFLSESMTSDFFSMMSLCSAISVSFYPITPSFLDNKACNVDLESASLKALFLWVLGGNFMPDIILNLRLKNTVEMQLFMTLHGTNIKTIK
jgi:hypothetical protein